MGSWYRYCATCHVWIEAVKCSGNTSNHRVFVHEDNLPASKEWFRHDSTETNINCWSIDPNNAKICLSQEDDVFIVSSSQGHTSCNDCETEPDGEDAPGSPPGGGGGGGSGGGGGGSGGGGSGGPPDDESDPEGIKVTVCANHVSRAQDHGWDVDRIYIYRRDEFDHSFVAQVGGICISVPIGPLVTPPQDAVWIGLGAEFDSCSDCTDGVMATLCLNDQGLPGAENAPEFWIRKPDMGLVSGFEYGVWCYEVPTGPITTIPEGAIIFRPNDDLPCSDCNRGVQFQLCAGEVDPGTEYWAEQNDIAALLDQYPTLTTVYQRIRGVCHSLDLTAAVSRIPLEAQRVAPRCQYASCDDCICLNGLELACTDGENSLGVPVRLCNGQNTTGWVDTWIEEANLPSGFTVFIHRGFCVFVNPSNTPSTIPPDAEILNTITNTQPDCASCLGNGGGDTFNPPDNDPCQQYPPGDPFRPWWCDGELPPENYYQLRNCDTGATTNYWLRESHICGVWNVVPCDIRGTVWKIKPLGTGNAECFEVFGPPQPSSPDLTADAWVTDGPLTNCSICNGCDCGNCQFNDGACITSFDSNYTNENNVGNNCSDRSGATAIFRQRYTLIDQPAMTTTCGLFEPGLMHDVRSSTDPNPQWDYYIWYQFRWNCTLNKWEARRGTNPYNTEANARTAGPGSFNGWGDILFQDCQIENPFVGLPLINHTCNGATCIPLNNGCWNVNTFWGYATISNVFTVNNNCGEPVVPA